MDNIKLISSISKQLAYTNTRIEQLKRNLGNPSSSKHEASLREELNLLGLQVSIGDMLSELVTQTAVPSTVQHIGAKFIRGLSDKEDHTILYRLLHAQPKVTLVSQLQEHTAKLDKVYLDKLMCNAVARIGIDPELHDAHIRTCRDEEQQLLNESFMSRIITQQQHVPGISFRTEELPALAQRLLEGTLTGTDVTRVGNELGTNKDLQRKLQEL